MRRKKIIIGAILALLLLCVPGYFGWRFFSIQYHYYRMTSAYTKVLKSGTSPQNDSQITAAYEQHRAALMKLGYFTKQQFYLKKLTARTTAFEKLLNDLQLRFPTQTGKIEGRGYIYGEPTFVVVWLHPDDTKSIESFIQGQDAK